MNPIDSNTVLYLPLNEGSVEPITVSGAKPTTGHNGGYNAYEYTTKNDYIKITPKNSSIITVSLWYYYNGVGSNWDTLLCRDGGTYHHLLINRDGSGSIGFYNSSFYDSGYDLVQGNWYHIVLTKNGNNSKLYINNNLVQDSNSSFDNSTYPLTYIGNYGSHTQGALGKIENVLMWDRELTSEERSNLYNETNIPNNTIFKFPFAYDYSGSGNNGAISGASYVKVSDGNYALKFDGSNDYIDVADNDTLNFSDNIFTIGVWFSNITTGGAAFYKGNSSYNREYFLYVDSTLTFLRLFNNGSYSSFQEITSETLESTMNPKLVVFTCDGTTVKGYIDGELSVSAPLSVNLGNYNSPLGIGRYPGGSLYLGGILRLPFLIHEAKSSEWVKKFYQDTYMR